MLAGLALIVVLLIVHVTFNISTSSKIVVARLSPTRPQNVPQWTSPPLTTTAVPLPLLRRQVVEDVSSGILLVNLPEPDCAGTPGKIRARREYIRIPSLEVALVQKRIRVMVDVGSPSSHLSLFVATSPDAFVFSFGVETRVVHLLPKRRNWSINPPDYTVIGPGSVDFLIIQAWDNFMPVITHVLQGKPRVVVVMPLGPQCQDLRPLLRDYRCNPQQNNKFVQCEQ
jgi:hypothetical protein